MKFAVVTLGSVGDLHPFLAVARALVERGHEVHLLTQAPYEAAVRAEGVGFLPIASQAEHERTLHHPLLWHPLHGFGVLWRHLAVPAIGPTIQALDALSQGAGKLTVFASPLAAGARLARERWPDRIRLLSGYTAPMGLRSTADPMFLGGWQVPSWAPQAVRRQLWSALDRWKLEPMARPALTRWTSQLGLPDLAGSLFGNSLHSPDGGVAMYPSWFAPVLASWQTRGVSQTGFPVFEPSVEAALSPAAAEFIDGGQPYVVVYPGSADQRAGTFADRAVNAALALGRRALVLSRFRSATASCASKDVLWVDEAPLHRVLPKANAFIHHGGIGSAAQGMAAQVPQLVLASAYDQFENGVRLQRLEQGNWKPLERASVKGLQNSLSGWTEANRVATLMNPPQSSRPRAPSAAVEETCELLDGTPMQSSLFDAPAEFQPDRVGSSRGEPQSYKLFMAIFPPADTGRRLARAGEGLARQHDLSKRNVLEAERLHITLLDLADFPPDRPILREWIDMAIRAGDSVDRPAFSVCFDGAMSFPESSAFVFRCDDASEDAIGVLRQQLMRTFKGIRPGPREMRTPHMTLLYDERRRLPRFEIEPIRWKAGRFALILSHRGLHHHQWIREWSLSSAD